MALKGLGGLSSRQRSHKKTLSALPNLVTFFNACSGFIALVYAIQGQAFAAACFIFFAAFFDMLDGRVARMLGLTSYFGAELDSLADAISFCCAPALLIFALHYEKVTFFTMAPSLLFLCAGLFRLARFNVQKNNNSDFFSGLPSPIAALLVACVIIALQHMHSFKYIQKEVVLTLFVILLAGLMVSSLPFPAFKKVSSFWDHRYLVVSIVISGICCYWIEIPVFLIIPLSYMLGTMIYWLTPYLARIVSDAHD
jgi:CDP-diacylglycerol---serine O-phosphatidyltransferase